jgi:hypothetical protein
MMPALRMERTKPRTVRATGWSLLAAVAGTVVVSWLAAWATHPSDCAPRPCGIDTTKVSLTGLYAGPVAVVVFATLAISSEYDTGLIRTTLAAYPRVPRRGCLLWTPGAARLRDRRSGSALGAAITATLAVLYVTPIAAQFVTDPQWHARIEWYSPMTAGLRPWGGVGWLCAYTGVVLLVGLVATVWRDA